MSADTPLACSVKRNLSIMSKADRTEEAKGEEEERKELRLKLGSNFFMLLSTKKQTEEQKPLKHDTEGEVKPKPPKLKGRET